MKNKDIEVRNIGTVELEDKESRNISGYAIVFDSESQDMGNYIEIIDRRAISKDMLSKCDVFALFNHDDNKVLARNRKGKGSLTLELDERGLKYSFEAPNTEVGNECLEHLKRGELFGSSFAFSVDWEDEEAQKWEKRNGKTYRTIQKIQRIYDVSPVFEPAYLSTSVSKRALDKVEEIDKQEQEERNKHFDEMISEIDKLNIDFNFNE